MMAKYLKIYEGVTSGTPGGREDGYSCDYYVIYDSEKSLVKAYGTRRNERYFKLESLHGGELNDMLKSEREKIRTEEEELRRIELDKKIAELKKEREKLR